MPIYQGSAAGGMLTSAMEAEIAAIIDAHLEATGAPRVFVHGLTGANCAGAGAHHRRPETNNRKGSGR